MGKLNLTDVSKVAIIVQLGKGRATLNPKISLTTKPVFLSMTFYCLNGMCRGWSFIYLRIIFDSSSYPYIQMIKPWALGLWLPHILYASVTASQIYPSDFVSSGTCFIQAFIYVFWDFSNSQLVSLIPSSILHTLPEKSPPKSLCLWHFDEVPVTSYCLPHQKYEGWAGPLHSFLGARKVMAADHPASWW